jgi:FMN phosphatase YigB (HAD superfamily)
MLGRYLADTCGVPDPSIDGSPSFDPAAIDAVVFDIGGVFLVPHPGPVREVLASVDVVLGDDEAFHRAHDGGVHAVAALDIPETDPAFWRHYVLAYLSEIGVGDEQVDACLAVWSGLYEQPVFETWRWAQQHNIDALARFVAAEMPIAIVSNNDGSASEQMRMFGVCQVGEGSLVTVMAIVDSGTVGVAKPDPAIFTPALDALGTAAARTLYVGDMVHADVRGAEAAGMPVVQIDPYGLHALFPHDRVVDLDALADLLFGPA